jgi:hypothetical protein
MLYVTSKLELQQLSERIVTRHLLLGIAASRRV